MDGQMVGQKRRITVFLLEDDPQQHDDYKRRIEELFAEDDNAACFEPPRVLEAWTYPEFVSKCEKELVEDETVDLAILDMNLYFVRDKQTGKLKEDREAAEREGTGAMALAAARRDTRFKRIIVFTGYSVQYPEREQISKGAYEYWDKGIFARPSIFAAELASTLKLPSRFALSKFDKSFSKLRMDATFVRTELNRSLLGRSPAMLEVKALICEAALSNVPVLITGETGTGKDVVATLIHRLSPSRGQPKGSYQPYALNCAEFREDQLLRGELFGAKRGAYTGLDYDKKGKLQEAHGSSLFLDEVGRASEHMQGLLLRAFEPNESGSCTACPVGGTFEDVFEFDVRLLAATDQDIQGKEFSRAFFHRLAGMQITLPPLRERREDIEPLIDVFREGLDFSVAAHQRLEHYHWPGNVRQLKQVIDVVKNKCKIAKKELATRDDIEFLLPSIDLEKKEAAIDVGRGLMTIIPSVSLPYDEVKSRLLAEYVFRQHQLISNGECSNDAYAETARRLGCSVSTVKERLREHCRLVEGKDA